MYDKLLLRKILLLLLVLVVLVVVVVIVVEFKNKLARHISLYYSITYLVLSVGRVAQSV
jgi:hypothetical protein